MLPKVSRATVSLSRVFFVAFLTVCCYHGASSLGSGQPPRPDDTKTNSSSGIATVGQGLSDEGQQSTTPSGEATGDAQDTSLGDPNSTGEAGAGPKGGGSETEQALKSDPLRSRFWQWLMTNRMIALYVVMGVALMILYVWRIGAKAKKLEELGTKMIVT